MRAPKAWHTAPTIGPPIGVLPRNTIACSASTRPRISGAARSCTMAVLDVMNTMLAKPTKIAAGNDVASVGEAASANMLIAEQQRALDDVAGLDGAFAAPTAARRSTSRC